MDTDNLKKMKDTYCTGYNHIDLSNTDIKEYCNPLFKERSCI